ncbi:hypothetical protein M9Y10_006125 [Tritrichomonas musculus]|uniref:Uncharacterized protein n=1 Tax=Tritrichomonas musculus TaxID=1915356 RepID=A0ABR2JFM3_9EUKA
MMKSQLPFDNVSTQTDTVKAIPHRPEEFVHYVEYLATSPQLDLSAVSARIYQFLNLSRIKPEKRQTVLFAIRDMQLPEDFWQQMLPQFKTELTNADHKFTEAILMAISSAPPNCIVQTFNNFNFILPYLENDSEHICYAAFYVLYKFRNYIKINTQIVQLTLKQLTSKLTQLCFLAVYLIKFYISIDFQDIGNIIRPYYNDLKRIIYVNGHIINVNLLYFILKLIHPSIQDIISILPHVSYPIAGFLIAAMPSCHDFTHIVDVPSDSIMPFIVDVINHPYCDGIVMELLITALQIVKMSQNNHFFDRITQHMLNSKSSKIQVISLFADVAKSLKELSRLLSKAYQSAKDSNFFYILVAISSFLATKDNIDITKELMKLLSSESDSRYWRLAASCVAYYTWHQKHYVLDQIQNILEVVKQINDLSTRSLFLVYLADIVPVHLRADLIAAMKHSLFSNSDKSGQMITTTKNDFKIRDKDDSISILLKIQLVSALSAISSESDLDDIVQELTQPIYMLAMQNGMKMRQQQNESRPSGRKESLSPSTVPQKNSIPLSPFIHINVIDLGLLASGLYYPSTLPVASIGGKRREFIEISPVYHALTVEIATVVVPSDRSLSIELRLSAKGVIPSLSVSFNVPVTLTPPQVPEWSINSLNEGSKVTQNYTFTINKLINPFGMIHIVQDGASVLDIKVCLPLIDMFEMITPDPDIERNIWQALRFQRTNVPLKDAMWVSTEGCIAVKNNVARASSEELLNMIPSALETHAVVD